MKGTKIRSRDAQALTCKVRARGDLTKMRQELREGTATGDVDIVVAVYDIPDTNVAVGNTRVQTIDQGAFREWVTGHDFENDPPLGFADHGDAISSGYYRSTHMIGFASSAEDTPEGLLLHTHYNLEKQLARDAYSDLLHNPAGVQFSFGWDGEETELRDGEEHVTKLALTEWSQVAFGAQRQAHLVAARAAGDKVDGVSLEALPNEIRGAWWEQCESVFRALEGWAYVAEVFSTSSESEGFVIAGLDDGRWAKVPWMRMEDESIGFDTAKAEELEQEWVATGKTLSGDEASRAAALATWSDDALRSAAAETTKVRSVEDVGDPVGEFYKLLLKEQSENA